jgi:hypothetical protein
MTFALEAGESPMFRAPAVVVIVALSLTAGRSGHLCRNPATEDDRPATCHDVAGDVDATLSVGGNWEIDHCMAADQSIPACAEGNSRPESIRLRSCCRVPQAIEPVMAGDSGAALAPPIYELSVHVGVHTPRRPVEGRVPLERRPLSTNLRI